MNEGQIRAEIRRLIGDTSSDGAMQRWSDSILLTRENMVQEEMAAFTAMLESQVDITLVSGTSEYAFTSVMMAIKKAYQKDDNDVYIPLRKSTLSELDMEDASWRDADGTPTRYYIRDNYIGLYPNPDYARAAGLRVEVVNRPTDLAAETDVPFNSEYQYYFAHGGICFGVARLCLMDEGKWPAATELEKRYFNVIKEIQKQISSENVDIRIPNIYEFSRGVPRRTR